jgi:hypothetical protein
MIAYTACAEALALSESESGGIVKTVKSSVVCQKTTKTKTKQEGVKEGQQ